MLLVSQPAGTFSSGLFETSSTTGDGSDRGFGFKVLHYTNGSSAHRFGWTRFFKY